MGYDCKQLKNRGIKMQMQLQLKRHFNCRGAYEELTKLFPKMQAFKSAEEKFAKLFV